MFWGASVQSHFDCHILEEKTQQRKISESIIRINRKSITNSAVWESIAACSTGAARDIVLFDRSGLLETLRTITAKITQRNKVGFSHKMTETNDRDEK